MQIAALVGVVLLGAVAALLKKVGDLGHTVQDLYQQLPEVDRRVRDLHAQLPEVGREVRDLHGQLPEVSREIRDLHPRLVTAIAQRPVQVNLAPAPESGDSQIEPLMTTDSAIMYGVPSEPSMVLRRMLRPGAGGTRLQMPQRCNEQLQTLVENFAGRICPTFLAVSGTYRLVFSPEVMQGVRAGALRIQEGLGWVRAWVRNDSTGRFAGHGKLYRRLMTPAGAAILVWQVLATVTAQTYLVRIDNKLRRLQTLIEGLQLWFETEEHGDLIGDWYYLNDIRQVLLSQDFTEREAQAFLSHIEGVERDCEKIQARVLLRMDALKQTYESLQDMNSSVEQFLQNAQGFAENCQHGIKSLAMALELQVVVCDLHSALRSSPELIRLRLADVTNRSPALQKISAECCDLLARPIEQAKFAHMFNVEQAKRRYDTEARLLSKNIEEAQRSLLSDLQSSIGVVKENVERQLAAANDPYLIDLQIQDGRILGASVPALEEARVEYAAFSKDN